jgi:copper chaperone CopZ
MESTIKIGGTTCIGCINRIELKLRLLGIFRFDYDFQNKSAKILYDQENTTLADLVKAIEDLGYEAVVR